MLSRVADSLFWMSRYMERTDGLLRVLKINYASSQDDNTGFSWVPVLQLYTSLSVQQAEALSSDSRSVLDFMVLDRDNPNSVLNNVTAARENGRSVQDHITKEMWQCLNDFYHTIRQPDLQHSLRYDDPVTVLDQLIKKGLLYFGTTDVTMARGEGNSFINLGKFLERAIQSADILESKLGLRDGVSDLPSDITYWKYLLMSISGYELYLKTYRSGFEARNVVEQVVLNTQFPRSILYAINRLQRYFERIRNDRNMSVYQEVWFKIGKLKSQVEFTTADRIMEDGLAAFLQETKDQLFDIGQSLNTHYFAYS